MLKNPPLAEVPVGSTVTIKTNHGIAYVGSKVMQADADALVVRCDAKYSGYKDYMVHASTIVNLVVL